MMKKVFGIALLSMAFFACNSEKSNETTTETPVEVVAPAEAAPAEAAPATEEAAPAEAPATEAAPAEEAAPAAAPAN